MKTLIGEIHGIKVYSKKEVPENEVWIEEHHRPNPVYSGGLLDSIAFTSRLAWVKNKKAFKTLKFELTQNKDKENA